MNKLIIAFTQLIVKVLGNLAFRTIAISKKIGNEEVATNVLLKKVEEVYALYDKLILKPIYSGQGKIVVEKDLERDTSYNGLRRVIQGLARFNSEKGNAAKKLLEIYEITGSINGLDYADESEVIKKTIAHMKSEEYAASITKAGLTEELADLEQKQKVFQETYLAQITSNAELRRQGTASGLRRDLEMALRSYYAYVWAMKNYEPWNKLYSELAELIKAAKNTIGKPEKDLTNDEIELETKK
ncbi:MAG: DUF6261 family protein [Phocaeicola sp.]|uniref:DUF6261 family protein n=1 Tax=Phocaeicola sp. TaxID=2773926 RepID=UPI003F9FCBD7